MSERDRQQAESRPILEWIAGILSAAVVAGLIGFLFYEAAFGEAKPPMLTVTIDRLEAVENGTLVIVAATNGGDEAAAEVGVVALVAGEGEAASRKEIRFDYVAANATRRGAFLIETPGLDRKDLRLDIEGYVEP